LRWYKASLSSKAMQKMMGVDEPDYGRLLSDMFVFESESVATDALCQPRVEFDVAFMLGTTLPTHGCTVADVLRATAFVCSSIEIIDTRFVDWNITLCDTIAANASSARVVLGGRVMPPSELDLRLIGVVVSRDEPCSTPARRSSTSTPPLFAQCARQLMVDRARTPRRMLPDNSTICAPTSGGI
jgi:2-keto-4-pentenoate hydratase